MRWVSFDCFGTLVDWHSGFAAILRPLAGDRTPEVMAAYHRHERLLEAETPHRLYKDVLAASLARAAAEVGVALTEAEARRLPDSWGTLPVFDDVEPMLAGLRAMGCRLAVLTNCDEDLFAQTERAFRGRFDLVVTAERVRDYKPSPAHFRFFSRSSGVSVDDWVHVACSWYTISVRRESWASSGSGWTGTAPARIRRPPPLMSDRPPRYAGRSPACGRVQAFDLLGLS